ncbi:E3 ubiquitin-protein ligase RNF213-like [Discoglossus pictus]
MKCARCGHVPQESSPKFCSECGQMLVPPVTRMEIQDNEAPHILSLSELEPGKELIAEVFPPNTAGINQTLHERVDEPSSLEDGSIVPPAKKKKKKKKKKNKGTSSDSDSQSSAISYGCKSEDYARPSSSFQTNTDTKLSPSQEHVIPSGDPKKNEIIKPSPLINNEIPVSDANQSLDNAESNSAKTHPAHEAQLIKLDTESSTSETGAKDNTAPKTMQIDERPAVSDKMDTKEKELISQIEDSSKKHENVTENKSKSGNRKANDIPRGSTENKNDISNSVAKATSKGQKDNESQKEEKSDQKKATSKGQKDNESQKEEKSDQKKATSKGQKDNESQKEEKSDQKKATSKGQKDDESQKEEKSDQNKATSKGQKDDESQKEEKSDQNKATSKGQKENESQIEKKSDQNKLSPDSNNSDNVEMNTALKKQVKDSGNKDKNNSTDDATEEEFRGPKTRQQHKEAQKKNKKNKTDGEDPVASTSSGSYSKDTNKEKAKGLENKGNKKQNDDTTKMEADSEPMKKNQLDSDNKDQLTSNYPETANKITTSNKKMETKETEHSNETKSMDPANFISVFFHVVVSKDFKLNIDHDKVIVRAGKMNEYRDWKDVVCHMHFTRDLNAHGWLYEGSTKISQAYVDKYIPYKYVVVRGKKEECEYELIYKFDGPDNSIVNRCLHIQSKSVNKKEWHQYDDIMCMKPIKGLLATLKDFAKKFGYKDDKILSGKTIAAEIMLDNIFSILTTCDSINLLNFFCQLQQFYLVTTESLVFEDRHKSWTSHGFEKNQVDELILKMLFKICQPFLNKNSSTDTAIIKNRLVAGLVCVKIVETYSLKINKEHLAQICSILCMEDKPKEDLFGELANLKAAFSEFKGMEGSLKKLCQECIVEDVDHWIMALPVLHAFTSADSSLMENKLKPEDVWAGLEALAYDKLLNRYESQKSDLLQFMINKKYLLQIDRTLFRSWLCLVPLLHIPTFLEQVNPPITDALTACCYKFSRIHFYSQSEKAEAILSKLLLVIQSLKTKPSHADAVRLCSVSLQLHNIICANETLRKRLDLPPLSAEIFLYLTNLANLKDTSDTLESQAPEIDNSIQNAVFLTRTWFQTVFPYKFNFYGYIHPTFHEELQVWNRLLNAGENVSKWKEALLSDFVRKIKQEDPIQQIQIYCDEQTDFKNLNLSIRKCFEDCAIEAVHLACKSQRNILSQLNQYNLQNFGKLVSTVIENSWPKDTHGNPVKDCDEILQYLLQWPDATHIFRLYGANMTLINEFSEDIQELVILSDSVFLEARNSLVSGDVLHKHLECIVGNKSQFLDICKLKIEKKENIQLRDVEKVLIWRSNELETLKREQRCVDSLLKMCQTVDDIIRVNTNAIKAKHSENLEQKPMSALLPVRRLGTPQSQQSEEMSHYKLSPSLMKMAENIHKYKNSYIFKLCWKNEAQKLADDYDNVDYEDVSEDSEDVELSLEGMEEELFHPCFDRYKTIYEDLKAGTVTFEVVDSFLKDYKNRYTELHQELKDMCRLWPGDRGEWIGDRIQQIEQYHQLHVAFDSARAIEEMKNCFNLSGDFKTLETLLEFAYNFEECKQKPLSCISFEVMQTKHILSEITQERTECLQQVVLRMEFFNWVKEALEDVNELKVFVDLASISAGENDMDVDRVACFHDAVLGYSSLLYELKPEFGFDKLMQCLLKLWKALENDRNLPKKLRDSARHIEWLKTVKESHGSVELSSLSLATTINKKGIYIIQAPSENKKITLDSVVLLHLAEDHQEGEDVRCYTLEELKELLNKLMLMSGKGDQGNIEVEKFSEIFANVQRLATSFIDLYLSGNMLFRTWEAKIFCADDSKFGVVMNFKVKVIKEIEAQGSLTELLPNICKTMENLLEQWMNYMNKERSQHYYLNYYTSEQLVYLCQQFQRIDISQEALMMLSFIKPACTKADTTKAVFSSRKVGFVGSSKLTSNPDKTMLHLKLQSCTDVFKKLELIWEYSMDYMSSLFPGCLDISTLGKSLESLATTEGTIISRDLHSSLVQGRPNLVLSPPLEILSCTIAIYMHSSKQALPSYDEVLLCTPNTTVEEVELFLRRCLTSGYNGKKIYSLLFADELSYDTAYKAEQLFNQLQAQSGPNYNLVIICNCDREHCYIPSAFSQYKVHMIPQKPLLEIQQYLAQHFTIAKDVSSAASVFKNGVNVGIVASERAGVGKSLYVKRLHKKLVSKLPREKPLLKTIRLIKPQVDENKVIQLLVPFLSSENLNKPVLFHIDITSSVTSGISEFLFKLLVLQYLMDSGGIMWKRQPCHLYIIEILESSNVISKTMLRSVPHGMQSNFIDFFPKISCCTPKEVLARITENQATTDCRDPGMDDEEFRSECFQRPFQYLIRFDLRQNLDTFTYQKGSVEENPARCLQLLLIYCGIIDPSWAELRNFTWFLNLQLKDCESSIFCNHELVGDTLQGFKNFVVNFMILMAKDFATPSLHIADQSPGRQTINLTGVNEEDLAPFLLRKTWESEPHPYIFFNDDHVSMTFIGFHLRPNNTGGVDAINPRNDSVIQRNIMSTPLYQGLQLQRVPFNVDFDQLPRDEKINKLCLVLGIQWPFDPDDTYELTMDNILKILAIKMRFRCGIPVIIMGETGCGKTRLIKFLCNLCKGFVDTENMKLVKVHGGTSADTIYSKILEAQDIALFNKENQCETVLFFDEANTTEAISSIKEALCDHTVEGEPLIDNSGLQIIAACNPYRKHTEEMIKRLESAGLGYRVKADETKERLGSIPLRQLVYRVHALPPSMMPLVWDFGQLNNETEKKYILQIVQRLANDISLSSSDIQLLTNVLSISQSYMRRRNDECSFVSLRDVERCVEVFKWFYNHNDLLVKNLKRMLEKKGKFCYTKDKVVWSLVLAVGVCYHASLENKDAYRKRICSCFPEPYKRDQLAILQEITEVQDLFLSGVQLRDTIARNLALKENLFMMVICIELKIPLFLVGKPGSSKSLAKTIVADAMQGLAAHTNLYKELKQIHLVSFQCSPHSTPEGIIGTFKHCSRFQEGKNLNEYVSVVVLDEIGLAEDSPKMPLKTLHPLLEDGCIDDDPLPHKKVGFIGISNWALDPAKMNRGIFVSRGDPNKNELVESASGICASNKLILGKVETFFSDFANAYQKVCKIQKKQKKEFFGLRDFYSLIKMIFAFTKHSQKEPTMYEIARAVLRNFSGKDEVNALDIFISNKEGKRFCEEINTIDLVKENLQCDSDDNECRYLLILTKNYAALQILQQTFSKENQQPEVIFGSSFPKDQEYSQICRNINRVKICMETGQMVILLNLQNLYESLYDALNQYYVYLASQKYVDLGLGTHRVKCRVHPNFRLIVIEEKEVVYKDFPIPLINRLEKHYMDINTVLTKEQKAIVQELEIWIKDFTTVNTEQLLMGQQTYSPSDVFIGYHSDTCASVVLQANEMLKQKHPNNDNIKEVKNEATYILLNCATPDSVIRLSRPELVEEYFKRQNHNSLMEFVCSHIRSRFEQRTVFTEITTFSRLLTSADKKVLEAEVQNEVKCIEVLSLQQFDTEHSFLKKIRTFLESSTGNKMLIIQTDFEEGSHGAHLVASAKYSAVNEINKVNLDEVSAYVYFITKLPRMQGGTSYVGFQGGLWQSVHIDDLRKSKDMVSDITALQNLTISQLFCEEGDEEVNGTERSGDPGESETNRGAQSNASKEEMETEEEMDQTQPDTEGHDVMDIQESRVTDMDIPDTEMENEPNTENDMETEMSDCKPKVQDILDTTILLRSCVQNAVSMLRDEENIPSRSTRRIEILINLLSTDDNMTASFLKILKVRLHGMLKSQEEISFNANKWVVREASNPDALQEAGTFSKEEISFNANKWVVREASNPDALQEAGTFRHTLWKRIQVAVTPLLAYLLSVLDKDANLEILVNTDVAAIFKSLWMFIFRDEKLLNVSYSLKTSSSNSETILVKNYMNLSICEGNFIPFSWKIKDYLEEIWAQAQYIQSIEGPEKKFLSIFSQAPLGQYISSWEESDRQNLLIFYQRDFILQNMSLSSITELQLIVFGLSSCIEEMRTVLGGAEMTLPWVHLGYHQFQHRLQNFSRIVAINPTVLDVLTKRIETLQSMIGSQMALDCYAAIACLEMLETTVLHPSPQAWLRQVKNLQIPIDLICSENYLQGHSPLCQQAIEQIKIEWNCVFSMALFIEHVLLDESVQNGPMQELLREHTIFLGKYLEGFADIKSQKPFLAIIDVLRKCRDAVGKLILRFGVQICPICQEDPTEPVCLPCQHVFCESCMKQWLEVGNNSCPMCKVELPENFTIGVSKELGDAIQKYAKFRQQCNGFFIDIICTLCFKDNTPPEEEVVLQLLSLIFIDKQCLLDGPKKYTKSLSPFEDSVDKTPVIRSVILKLLLKYSFDDIKKYVQKYLSAVQESNILSKEDTSEVYLLFVNCLEDSMYEKARALQDSDKTIYLREEGSFLKHYLQNSNQLGPKESSIHFLQAIARIRLALDTAAELLVSQNQVINKHEYLQYVKDFCSRSGNDWYRVYLIRKLANQSGIETVQKMFKDEEFKWLFPPRVIQKKENQSSQIDLFLVCGNDYKMLRDGIGKALLECKEESLKKAQEGCKSSDCEQAAHLLLAVFREITMLYATQNHVNPAAETKHDAVKTFIHKSKVLKKEATKQFLQSLLNNSRPILKVGPGMTSLHCSIIGLAMHTAAVLLNRNHNLLEPLKNLAFSPDTMQNSYLPTMPEDMLAYAKTIFREVRWYVCPNNHYCAIGECGQPMELSRCVDCGAQVGGQNHLPQPGFNIAQQDIDRTQTGHILGDPERQGSAVAPDRELAAPVFILLRLLTHLSMILGTEEKEQNIIGILKPQVRDPGRFLFQHIAKDLEHLKNTLGKSVDETTTFVHLLLCHLLNPHHQPGQWPVNFDQTLSTKEGRNNWEKHMATIFIAPVLKSLDRDLLEVNNYISKDERISSNPIVKIVYGNPLTNGDPLELPQDSNVHCSKIWSCKKRVSIEYLQHVAQQKDGKDVVPVLWKFLEKESELRMVKFLPDILNLQKELVKRFQNHRDMDNQTIKDFLASIRSDGARYVFEKRIEIFISTWNHLRNSLHVNGEIKLPEGTCEENITMMSAFAMLLPRRQGLGLCATALISYLISLHNNFVYIVEKYTNDEQKYSISAAEVMDLHVISYELEKDLIPIILSNCQYSVEKGGETLQEFDLEKIQRQITSRFLQGKPFITMVGLPTFIHSHDRNYENLFMDVKKRLIQKSLPNSAINTISKDLNSYSDVCEALHIVEVTLGFLAMSGGDAELLLPTYVDNILQMGEQTSPHVFETLKRCHLKHAIAVWQLLNALKSEHLLRLKRDPFVEVDTAYKQKLNQESQQLLNLFLEQNGPNLFLLELHEMIMLKLKKPRSADDFSTSWTLRDTLGPLLENKDISFPELESEFPEQIALAHCIETWKFAAKMKWKRH